MVLMVKLAVVVVVLLAVAVIPGAVHGDLEVGFYQESCPSAEALVNQAVTEDFQVDSGVAPGLIRMHFHDCFVRGCDASVMLNVSEDGSTEVEKIAIPNRSLRGFGTINKAKAAIESECPGVVSCSDILAFAARDSSNLSSFGAISWDVPAGRRDGRISIESEALSGNLAPPTLNASALVDNFAQKNLTAEDMVILSGAHSLGIAHCPAFITRLYENSTIEDSPPQTAPGLSLAYADLLRRLCPSGPSALSDVSTFMDIITPNTLDNKYYVGVLNNLGLFTSDNALREAEDLKAIAEKSARHAAWWGEKFGVSMVNMGGIMDTSGAETEIRTNCELPNGITDLSNRYIKTRADS